LPMSCDCAILPVFIGLLVKNIVDTPRREVVA
jgi:hypothetical protein